MKNITKPSAIVTILAALLSLSAGVLFQMIGGIIGAMKYNYYNPIIVGLLIGGLFVTVLLLLCKLPGLASFVATTVPGVSLCLFFAMGDRPPYWHIVDVFMGIDEKAFDPNFLIFCILLVLAFLLGEIAIYMRKPGQVKA